MNKATQPPPINPPPQPEGGEAAAAVLEHLRVQAQGLRFDALAAGPADGPLLMLLHGFPETSHAWRHHMAPLAAAGFRVVAPDQRGYAGSDKPRGVHAYRLDTVALDVIGMAASLGHAQFAVVGHDWGAVVAWQLAARHSAHIRCAAVLNGPHPATLLRFALRNPRQLLKSAYVGLFQLPLAPELLLRANHYKALELALTQTSRPGTFTDEDLRTYREAWAAEGALTAMLNWYRALLLPAALPAARITVPVRILWGDKDKALEPGLAEESAGWCTHSEVFHLPGASHWLHHEESQRVGELLLAFLQEHGGPSVASPAKSALAHCYQIHS